MANANVEMFGYWQEHLAGNRFRVRTKNFAEHTSEAGLVEIAGDDSNRRHQWLAIATTPQGRFAFLGFRSIWSGEYYDHPYRQVKVFTITDRPVYRPEQKVYFKGILRKLGDDGYELFTDRTVRVAVEDSNSGRLLEKELPLTARGTFNGEVEIPGTAKLGYYRITATVGEAEASGMSVWPVDSLEEMLGMLWEGRQPAAISPPSVVQPESPPGDLADVRGQGPAKRALEIAAAGLAAGDDALHRLRVPAQLRERRVEGLAPLRVPLGPVDIDQAACTLHVDEVDGMWRNHGDVDLEGFALA